MSGPHFSALHHQRHTRAILLKNRGVPARVTQLILGHSSIVTTKELYQHADLPGQISALAKLEASFTRGRGTFCRQLQPSAAFHDGGRTQS